MTQRISLEKIHNIIQAKNGQLLKCKYKNVNSVLKIQCEKDHIWSTPYDSIRKGSWCPFCSQKAKKSIKDANFLAKKRGGKCLSKKYINNRSKLWWICNLKHKWQATFTDIKSGRWCPKCKEGTYEKICRTFFETLFDEKFPTIRPIWLVNEDGNRLELDGYCSSLGIAFEHNGMQHYKNVDFFGNNLIKNQKHDLIKEVICKKMGIKLIIIPQLFTNLKIDDLKEFIKNECINKNIILPKNYDNLNIDISSIYILDFNNIKDLLKTKNIICLSKKYLGAMTKLKWKCKNNHQWEDSAASIRQKCSKNTTICSQCKREEYCNNQYKQICNIAESNNGQCLSNKYIHSMEKMQFRCQKNHIWYSTGHTIKAGNWCQKCHMESLANRKRK